MIHLIYSIKCIEDILQHMFQRDHCKEIGYEESYRASRNRTVEMIKQAKTDYYTNVIEQNKSNSKMKSDYLRQIAPKDSKQLPSSVKDSDTKLTDPQDIANRFNYSFTMIVDKYVPCGNDTCPPDYLRMKNVI